MGKIDSATTILCPQVSGLLSQCGATTFLGDDTQKFLSMPVTITEDDDNDEDDAMERTNFGQNEKFIKNFNYLLFG